MSCACSSPTYSLYLLFFYHSHFTKLWVLRSLVWVIHSLARVEELLPSYTPLNYEVIYTRIEETLNHTIRILLWYLYIPSNVFPISAVWRSICNLDTLFFVLGIYPHENDVQTDHKSQSNVHTCPTYAYNSVGVLCTLPYGFVLHILYVCIPLDNFHTNKLRALVYPSFSTPSSRIHKELCPKYNHLHVLQIILSTPAHHIPHFDTSHQQIDSHFFNVVRIPRNSPSHCTLSLCSHTTVVNSINVYRNMDEVSRQRITCILFVK